MNKNILNMGCLCLSVLAVAACTPRSQIATMAPGKYESTTKTTNSDGTDTSVKKTTVVQEDRYGNKSGTVQTETTRDPEGLMNKSTTKSTTTVR